ncbi:MAG TPA: universal stress protein [Symbiobacteriaceae bacterium]|nr:universal stress protein [Symbiobacteriaceae bacterium]
MYHKILVATDGSQSSLKAAQAAARLARLTPDATVTVLYVLHVPAVLQPMVDIPMDAMVRNTGRAVIDSTVGAMELPEVQLRTEIQVGDPATEIVQFARAGLFDLVVMGTRGLSPLKEMFLGGVSHRVANTAPCPVLLVR